MIIKLGLFLFALLELVYFIVSVRNLVLTFLVFLYSFNSACLCFSTAGWRQAAAVLQQQSRVLVLPSGRRRRESGRLPEDGDSVRDAQQVSAGAGLQPHAVRGQDSGACGGALLLAPALVPGHPGSGAGGHAVHHHHLHPEVTFSDSC